MTWGQPGAKFPPQRHPPLPASCENKWNLTEHSQTLQPSIYSLSQTGTSAALFVFPSEFAHVGPHKIRPPYDHSVARDQQHAGKVVQAQALNELGDCSQLAVGKPSALSCLLERFNAFPLLQDVFLLKENMTRLCMQCIAVSVGSAEETLTDVHEGGSGS